MSVYEFFASNMPLKTADNTQIEFLSIDEAVNRGIPMPNWYSNDMIIDRTKKNLLYAPNEECLREIQISNNDSCEYSNKYSDKSCYCTLDWGYSDERAARLIEYITEHLIYSSEIELWNVWLGKYGEPIVKRCSVDSLTIFDIKEVHDKDPYENPYCLIVYK